MTNLKQELETMHAVLIKLKDGMQLLKEYGDTKSDMWVYLGEGASGIKRSLFLGLQDSVVQRFAYCTDLFWQVLKLYAQEIKKIDVSDVPQEIIQASVKADILSEQEAQECMNMLGMRNKASHMYQEKVAQEIMQKIPGFYNLMHLVVNKIQEKSA